MNAGTLDVIISANSASFQSEINKANQKVNELATTSAKASNKMSGLFTGIASGLTALGLSKVFGAISNSMGSAIKRFDTLNNYPRVMSNLGIGAEESKKSIQRLVGGLEGLPTTLNDGATAVQRFTSANGNIKASTEMFLALNNAVLAGGASAEIQSSALEQLSQSYSKGKPDMMEWRTAMTAMPAQMKQVAQAMGYMDANQLGEALRSGKVSMNDFMLTLVKLNKEGINGFGSFEEQARNATGGISTSMTNIQTAITRGLAEVMNAIGQSNIAGFFQGIARAINSVIPYITAFVKVMGMAVSFISGIFGGKKAGQKNEIGGMAKNSNTASKSLNSLGGSGNKASKGIDKATGSAKKLKKELIGLAGFDEMTVLKENDNPSSGSGGSAGNVGGAGALNGIDLSGFSQDIQKSGNKVDEIVQKMLKVLNPLSKINFNPLKKSFDNLVSAIKPFGRILLDTIKQAYDKVLVPLARFTIQKALPTFFNLLAGALKILNPVINAFKNAGIWLLDNFLKPIAKLVLNSVVSAIQGIASALNKIGESIQKNKTAQAIIEGIAKGILTFVTAYKLMQGALAIGTAIQTAINNFKAFQTSISVITASMNAMPVAANLVSTSLTAMQIVVGTLTGQITLSQAATAIATKAQLAWNTALSTNPIGVVLASLALLTGAVVLLTNVVDAGTKAEREQAEAMKEKAKVAEEANKQWQNYKGTQEEKVQSIISELAHTQSLKNELIAMADQNGVIQEQDKARAEFILGELNSALGTEYTLVNNQIRGYKDLSATIDEHIQTKKIQLMLEAREEEYKKAVIKVSQAKIDMEQAEMDLAKAQNDANENYNKANRERLADAKKQYEERRIAYESMSNSIRIYEQGTMAELRKDHQKAIEILEDKKANIRSFESVQKLSSKEQTRILKEQQDKTLANYLEYKANFERGISGFTKGGVEQAREYAISSAIEYRKAGGQIPTELAQGIAEKDRELANALNQVEDKRFGEFANKMRNKSTETGRWIPEGIGKGIDKNAWIAERSAESLANRVNAKFRKIEQIHSPSKVFYGFGNFLVQGLANALNDKSYLAVNEVENMAKDIKAVDISNDLDLDKNLKLNKNFNVTSTLSNQNVELINSINSLNDKDILVPIKVNLGNKTLFEEMIKMLKDKQFETNGGFEVYA